jgi:hypothetical protein
MQSQYLVMWNVKEYLEWTVENVGTESYSKSPQLQSSSFLLIEVFQETFCLDPIG